MKEKYFYKIVYDIPDLITEQKDGWEIVNFSAFQSLSSCDGEMFSNGIGNAFLLRKECDTETFNWYLEQTKSEY